MEVRAHTAHPGQSSGAAEGQGEDAEVVKCRQLHVRMLFLSPVDRRFSSH